MIPQRIVEYLETSGVPYERRLHRRAFTAQELAAAAHVKGRKVAKSVLVKAGDTTWIAVLPSTELVDESALAKVLKVPSVRLMRESEFERFFPDCEPGAEPPFGRLFGLPVVVESSLANAGRILLRAGSHEEAIEMKLDDFLRLEQINFTGSFGRAMHSAPGLWSDWPEEVVVP